MREWAAAGTVNEAQLRRWSAVMARSRPHTSTHTHTHHNGNTVREGSNELVNRDRNPPKQHVMLFDIFFLRFSDPRLNYFLQFSSCGPWRVFSHSNSPPHRALGRYRHTSSSRQFHNIFCWLEILNYCPDGGNGNFHCSSSFLKTTSLICEAQLSFAAHQKYILCFFLIVMDD